jgi:hypothetical protein
MLVLVGVLLVLIPMAAILYPFLRRQATAYVTDDESSTHAELSRRWEAAFAGIRTTELERAIGNLAEEDYRLLREQYMTEAAMVMKAMELEEYQEQDLLAGIEREVRAVRHGILGGADDVATGPSAQESVDE